MLNEMDASLPGSLTVEDARAARGPWPLAPADDERARPRPHGRRREPRYEPRSNLLWMQWWEGGEYLGRPARLVNVSRGGAMIVAAALLRERQAVRIYLEESDPPAGVDATVLGVVEGRAGLHQIRLAFQSACPDAFLDAAAQGFESWLAGGRSSR
jgi:hypothetical protein